MKSLWLKSGVVAVTAIWSLGALAASTSTKSTPGAATSVADADILAPKSKKLPLSIGTLHIYNGPQVSDPGASFSVDGVDSKSRLYIRNQLSLGYALGSKTKVTGVVDFDLNTTDPSSNPSSEGFHWRDSFVKLSHSSLYENKIGSSEINLAGDLRLFVPSSLNSRTHHNLGGARISLNPSVQFGKSPWSLSAVNFARMWFQSRSTKDQKVEDAIAAGVAAGYEDGRQIYGTLPRAQLYTGPQVNYAANDNVTAFVLYEALVTYDTFGMPDTLDPASALADVSPGVDIKLHDRVTITPALLWYTTLPIKTTSINLSASFTLL